LNVYNAFFSYLTLTLQILALSLCTASDDTPAFKFEAPSNAGPFESSPAQTNCHPNHTTAVVAKGANVAIQQLQNFHKTNNPGKRRQVIPLRHAPLADLRKQNWAELIPENVLNKDSDLGISVHLSRDIAVGGDAAMAGAAVFTHSNVPGHAKTISLIILLFFLHRDG
jgi:hypothetical protein